MRSDSIVGRATYAPRLSSMSHEHLPAVAQNSAFPPLSDNFLGVLLLGTTAGLL